jgi:hypothetical protein
MGVTKIYRKLFKIVHKILKLLFVPQLRVCDHEFYEFTNFTNLYVDQNHIECHQNCPLGQFISKIS